MHDSKPAFDVHFAFGNMEIFATVIAIPTKYVTKAKKEVITRTLLQQLPVCFLMPVTTCFHFHIIEMNLLKIPQFGEVFSSGTYGRNVCGSIRLKGR